MCLNVIVGIWKHTFAATQMLVLHSQNFLQRSGSFYVFKPITFVLGSAKLRI